MIAELVEQKSAHAAAMEGFERAAGALGVTSEVRAVLAVPERAVQVTVPVKMDSGETRQFEAFRVQHSTARGPARGGTCYSPDVTLDQMKALAMEMTWRWAVLNIPFGGGKGGVAVNRKKLSPGEVESLNRRYTVGIAPLSPDRDTAVPGEAQGRGVFYAARAACEHLHVPLKGARVVVEGFGYAGSVATLLLEREGAVIIGASDTRGAICNPKGLDIARLIAHKHHSGSVVGFSGSEPIMDCELLGLECDVLLPAAAGNAIHCQNASVIRTRVVAEAAEHPVTENADRVLDAKGVFVVPAILSNAGCMIASSFEPMPNEQDLYSRLERVLLRSFHDVLTTSCEHGVNLRCAAHLLGIGRAAEAVKLRAMHA